MLWILTLGAQIWFGFEISYLFLDRGMSQLFIFSFGIPSGIGLSSTLFYFLSFILGTNIFHLLIHLIFLLFGSYALFSKRLKVDGHHFISTIKNNFLTFLELPATQKSAFLINRKNQDKIFLFIYIFLSFYFSSKIYLHEPRNFPLILDTHLTEELSLISSFHHGCNKINGFFIHPTLFIRHPNFSGHFSASNWLTAFHSSMLQIGFAGLRSSLVFPTFFLLLSYFNSLYYLSKQFNIPSILSFFAPIISLTLSGFGFLRFLYNDKRTSRTNDYISQSGYGKCPRFHPLFHLFFGFRHNSLSLPLITGLIYILFFSVKYKISQPKNFKYAGFIFGFVMPSVQYQSFVAFIVFFLIFYIIQISRPDNFAKLQNFVVFTLIGFLLHIPRYIQFISSHNDFPFFSYEVQWKLLVHHEFIPPLSLWWNNCGVFIIVFLFLSLFQLESNEYYIFLPSSFCFFFFNFFKLQNYVQYNIFAFLSINYTIGTCIMLATLYRFSKAPKDPESRGVITALSLLVIISCTVSGVMGIKRQLGNDRNAWTQNDEIIVKWIMDNTPKNAVFLSPVISFNIVSGLAGRMVYFENNDVLTHTGFNFTHRENVFRKFSKNMDVNYQNADDDVKEIFEKVDYILIPDNENNLNSDEWKEIYHQRGLLLFENRRNHM